MSTAHNTTQDATQDTARSAAFASTSSSRLASLALSAVLTLSMLVGINALATSDNALAAQMAQTSTPRA